MLQARDVVFDKNLPLGWQEELGVPPDVPAPCNMYVSGGARLAS